MAEIFYTPPPKSPIVKGVKYDCHIMHPLKDQREGVKYSRGVKIWRYTGNKKSISRSTRLIRARS